MRNQGLVCVRTVENVILNCLRIPPQYLIHKGSMDLHADTDPVTELP
jgi:hypothetical protein